MNKKTNAVFSSQEINKEFLAHLKIFMEKVQGIFSTKDNVYLTHKIECKLMKKGSYILICDETHRTEGNVTERSYCAINVKTGGIHNASSHSNYTKSSVANIFKPESYSHMDDGQWLYQWSGGLKIVIV